MKKLLLILILLFGVFPAIHKGRLTLGNVYKVYADDFGSEYDPSVDQCDESSPSYDPTTCETATCDPTSVNYDPGECAAQACDETSSHYDPTACELEDCDPDSPGYDDALCDSETCDPTSPNFDEPTCSDWNTDCTTGGQDIGQSTGQFADENITGSTGTGRFAPFINSTSQGEQAFTVNLVNGVLANDTVQTFPPTGGTMTYYTTTVAIVHTHPLNDWSAPSAVDVFAMDGYRAGAPNFTTSYVDSYSGQTFALVITDASALSAFVAANPGAAGSNNDWDPNTTLGAKFFDAVNGLEATGLSANDARTAALGMILQGSGVSLYGSYDPSASGSFTQIGAVQIMNSDGTPAVDGNGKNIYIKTECPSN